MNGYLDILERIRDWSELQRRRMLREVGMMRDGKMRVLGAAEGGALADATEIWLVEYEMWAAELGELLDELARESGPR